MGRISDARLQAAQQQLSGISAEDHDKVRRIAGIIRPLRSFIHRTPDDYGMKGWHDLSIPSADGTPLEAWYIPAKGGPSDRLVIYNHASPMCRSGFPGTYGPPWSFVDDGDVDFVLQYKRLTDAGYNVLTYDLRNHGASGTANNGISGLGQWEWRDCVGVKAFVDQHPDLSRMKVALFSQCLGGISQYVAISRDPDLFSNVRCMCSPLVPTPAGLVERISGMLGVSHYQELVDLEFIKMGGFPADDMSPRHYAPDVKMPVLMWQLRDDLAVNNPGDAQGTFDLLGSSEKELIWIEGTSRRFKDGYNWFGQHPGKVIEFLERHMTDD